ncbi:hypothetical protein [Winogradskyella immobilis]|uniref:Lipoprotein n=1 Tax=Winogradskyella immobilis TaxID=2816852 RepID=A0ABS8EMH0_9FLAO|nr:hypothetical protein [Winogradskyella immobilis]MCC1484420.1 hypothetical protein [Winogradskyella immobilis]MCG0016512.1 hypothetical protein [Winogradskyella immobilis]
MKKIIFILAAAALLATACTSESSIEEIEQTENNYSNLSYTMEASKRSASRGTLDEFPCVLKPLIAGQHIDAGVVSFDIDGDEIIISYETNEDWDISAVHFSISACDNLSFPSTGSGNPKIGRFEYASEHEDNVNEISYYFNAEELGDQFCIAAHAVVENENGDQETAWAEGEDFGGRSWAMYATIDLSGCRATPVR